MLKGAPSFIDFPRSPQPIEYILLKALLGHKRLICANGGAVAARQLRSYSNGMCKSYGEFWLYNVLATYWLSSISSIMQTHAVAHNLRNRMCPFDCRGGRKAITAVLRHGSNPTVANADMTILDLPLGI
jgi:hypothetical protein